MRVRFGDCIFDRDTRQLSRDGRPVELTPKAFELLDALLASRPRVLSKEALQEELWPDTFISETSLARLVSEVRKAIGDTARKPRFVRTAHGYGYAFCGQDVETEKRPAAVAVAVLPFVDMSSEKDQDYFCEGVAEELIDALARIEGLKVVARTSSFRFKSSTEDIREIGRQLGVDSVLEGSVRKSGNRLRISAKLIGVADGCQLWSERYDREMHDVLAIQDEIAEATVAQLRGVLTDREREALKSPQSPRFQAYDCYLRGRQYFHRGGRGFTVSARQMFLRAIEVDPAYAAAYAGIADACAFLYMYYEPDEQHLGDAEAMSRKAVELDPHLAEAHTARGLALSLHGRHEESKQAFERAIGLNRKLFEACYLYARTCFAQGEMAAAAELFERAAALRSEDLRVPSLLAKTCRCLGRHGDALAAHRRAVELAEHALELNPDDMLALALGACGLVEIGERERGLGWAERAAGSSDGLLYYVACCYARADETERALRCLEDAIRAGWSHWDWLRHDCDLAALRDLPRFRELVPP